MFFKRVLHLGAQKILDLTQVLGVGDDIKEKIWTIMKSLLSIETGLLTNRHLDQLIMCTIYGVCKVQNIQPQITFNNIITKYADMFKNQRQVSPIYISVVIDYEKNERKDIISFYNEVYIKVMKEYIIATKNQSSNSDHLYSKTPIIN